jgi:predicted SprT family Zn-dependent metalloprotease
MKRKVKAKLSELQRITKEIYGIDIDITVKYKLNSANVLGYYRPTNSSITLNEKLLLEFGDIYINEVFVHEFAHAVIDVLYPTGMTKNYRKIMPHGREFKEVCRNFGIIGRATTSTFANSKVLNEKREKNKQNRVEMKCSCRTHKVSKTLYNRIKAGRKYICRSCGTYIKESQKAV